MKKIDKKKVKEFVKEHGVEIAVGGICAVGVATVCLIAGKQPKLVGPKSKEALDMLKSFVDAEKVSDLEYIRTGGEDTLADMGKLGEYILEYFGEKVTPESKITGVIVAIKNKET